MVGMWEVSCNSIYLKSELKLGCDAIHSLLNKCVLKQLTIYSAFVSISLFLYNWYLETDGILKKNTLNC